MINRLPTWALIAVGGLAVLSWPAFPYWATERIAQRESLAAVCAGEGLDAVQVLDYWRQKSVVRDVRTEHGMVIVDVDTKFWSRTGSATQIKIGVSAYCTIVDEAGRGTALIRGSTQEDLGAVVDGNWTR